MKWALEFFRRVGTATRMDFETKIARDDAHGVWYVLESAIPGLHAEAGSLDELVEIINDIAPDLIEANCLQADVRSAPSFPLRIESLVNPKLSAAC